jgi:hypothetical protein
MEDPIDPAGARLRSIRQWGENGFDQLAVGLLMFVLGGIYPYAALKMALLGPNYGMIAPFLLAALILPFVLISKRVLARVIYPRTGYVIFRPAVPRIWTIVIFGGLGVAQAVALAYWGFKLHDLGRMAGPAAGVLFAACALWGAITYKVPQYYWFAGLSLVLGGVTFFAGAKIEGAIWVMVGDGAGLALDGALRMRRFLHTHPIVNDYRG